METSIAELIRTDFAEFKNSSCHGFFDWFCNDKALPGKSERLSAKVRMISKHTKRFDPEKCYVFYKNNCPCIGPLYDDFRICDIESGDVIYTVIPKSSHSKLAEVWGQDNEFQMPIVAGSWKDVMAWFKNDA